MAQGWNKKEPSTWEVATNDPKIFLDSGLPTSYCIILETPSKPLPYNTTYSASTNTPRLRNPKPSIRKSCTKSRFKSPPEKKRKMARGNQRDKAREKNLKALAGKVRWENTPSYRARVTCEPSLYMRCANARCLTESGHCCMSMFILKGFICATTPSEPGFCLPAKRMIPD